MTAIKRKLPEIGRALIRMLPERLAIALSYWESCRPPKANITAIEEAAMASARHFRFGSGANAWTWGDGPLVILVHGWGGRAAQMAPLAQHLASRGFQVVAPDITGHGDARRRHTNWDTFFRDLAALQQHLGREVHAYLGHSVGGQAIMAARHISGVRAARYVCVCSMSHPSQGAEILQRRVAPSAEGMARYKAFIARTFRAPSWEALTAGWIFNGAGPETLLVYDLGDRFMSHAEGDRIAEAHPQVVLQKIRAGGHNRILLDAGFMSLVDGFLSPH
ncbi:MAG: alpha/beta fold hydrolase [Rhizobacter sp.]